MSAPIYETVSIEVPGSTANLGLWFDAAGAALSDPTLKVTLQAVEQGEGLGRIGIGHDESIHVAPGRQVGDAGRLALQNYLHEIDETQHSLKVFFSSDSPDGYRSGGTGLSGAEAVGSVLAAAVMFDQLIAVDTAINASAAGEPGGHKDNVAPSVDGGIQFLTNPLGMTKTHFHRIQPPEMLGLAIVQSSHQKQGGTEATRAILEVPRSSSEMKGQLGRATMAALALQDGDVQTFLELVYTDEFHEPKRANAGLYGNFTAHDFWQLKQKLYDDYGVGLAVSGAGPNLQLWYDREFASDAELAGTVLSEWFGEHAMTATVKQLHIPATGALQYAQRTYANWVMHRSDV